MTRFRGLRSRSRRPSFFTARRPLVLRGRLPGISLFQRRSFKRMRYVPLYFGGNAGKSVFLSRPPRPRYGPPTFIGPITQFDHDLHRVNQDLWEHDRYHYEARQARTANGLARFSFNQPTSSSNRSYMTLRPRRGRR